MQMTSLQDTVLTLFLVMGAFTFASWMCLLFELIAVANFMPLAFRIGPVVIRGHLNGELNYEGSGLINAAGYKAFAADECKVLFRPRFGMSVINTPLPVKGILTSRPGSAVVEFNGRIPLSTLLFSISWTLSCIALAVLSASFGEARAGITFGFAGLIIMILILVVSWSIESKRAKAAVQNLVRKW